MNARELKVGYSLIATSSRSWLVKDQKYMVTEINDNDVVFDKALHWPLNTVADNFVVALIG